MLLHWRVSSFMFLYALSASDIKDHSSAALVFGTRVLKTSLCLCIESCYVKSILFRWIPDLSLLIDTPIPNVDMSILAGQTPILINSGWLSMYIHNYIICAYSYIYIDITILYINIHVITCPYQVLSQKSYGPLETSGPKHFTIFSACLVRSSAILGAASWIYRFAVIERSNNWSFNGKSMKISELNGGL